ncbi:MAG: SDR family NAD(P)-dependent oxidoreductase [Microthrixaceae bacterium]|nr:SDR family NAD(P)-dependent oxidoreductase [Microthrixaceae bacterium]
MHPGRLAVEVAKWLPEDAIVAIDGGDTGLWAHLAFTHRRPRSLLWTGHYGHLGTGLPYAIGAKLANPDRPTVLFTGDGAFGFNLQELETAARVGANVVVVINCDHAWGMEARHMRKNVGTTIGVPLSEVRYDQVAEALGCHAELVDHSDALPGALQRAMDSGRPAVVQVLVDPRRTRTHPAWTTSLPCTAPRTPEPRVARNRGVAVVTGGAGGLGRALTSALDRVGYEAVPADLNGTATGLDVTDAAACRALAEELQPTLWINNAGLSGAGALMERSDASVEAMIGVNFLGVVHGTRAALSTMLPAGRGRIINIASLAGWGPVPNIAIYSGTKNAVRAFSIAADAEIGSRHLRVQCLLPDGIATPMVDITDARHLMSFTGKRLLDPEEVADAALALLAGRRAVASVPPQPRGGGTHPRSVPIGCPAAEGADRAQGQSKPAPDHDGRGLPLRHPDRRGRP